MVALGGREIHACRTDGTDLWKVTAPNPAVNVALGGWSPDGQQIVYIESIKGQVNASKAVIATLAPDGRAAIIERKRIKLPQLVIKGGSFSICLMGSRYYLLEHKPKKGLIGISIALNSLLRS